eukprot:586159-Pyramimonas_sp.AAC.1
MSVANSSNVRPVRSLSASAHSRERSLAATKGSHQNFQWLRPPSGMSNLSIHREAFDTADRKKIT